MASRGSAGFWIAIAFLAVLAGIFATLFFQRETLIQQLTVAIKSNTTEKLINDWKNPNVRAQAQKELDLNLTIKKRDESITALEDEGRRTKDSLQAEQGRSEVMNAKIGELKNEIKTKQNRITELQQEMDKIRETRREDLEARIAQLETLYSTEQGRTEVLSREKTRLGGLQEALRKAFHSRIMTLQRENHDLRDKIAKVEKLSGSRITAVQEDHDGAVIQVDIDSKFVVVDLGRIHKVKPGMRFDVIRWRLNKWDFMGAIELTKVDATTSQAVILDKIVQQKVDPVTGYVATDPEEKYSPFAAGGAQHDKAIELVKGDLEEKPSMKRMDPIVNGDLITNPFYSRKRVLRFMVTGEPVHYKVEEIKQQVRRYGGILQDSVDVDTDYLVLGRIPDETEISMDENAKIRRLDMVKARDTAKRYGIPVMREVELFQFLRE